MIRILSTLALACVAFAPVLAQGPQVAAPYGPTDEYVTHDDVRAGGVLARSYGYHQRGHRPLPPQPPNIMPPNGAYGYGFPVTTYRWGWFGAERYYPRVFWFSGYYNECVRCAYRQGY